MSHDIVVRVLEHVLDTQDHGFTGNRRLRLVELLLFSIDAWAKELRRRGGKGGATMGPGMVELLERCSTLLQQQGLTNPGGKDVAHLRTETRRLIREVTAQVERVQTGGSLRFA
jgi:nuclear pore complex protein Nup155